VLVWSTESAGKDRSGARRFVMSIGLILIIVLVVLLLGAVPTWPHSRSWGYYPSGGLGLALLIVLILVLLRYI
jgi:uncharacterized protein DUF3309